MSDSDEDMPIGRKMPVLSGVTVGRKSALFSPKTFVPAPKPKAVAVPVKAVPVKAAPVKAAPAPGPSPLPEAPMKGPVPLPEAEEEAPVPLPEAPMKGPVPLTEAEEEAPVPLPEAPVLKISEIGEHTITRQQFFGDKVNQRLKGLIQASPVEVAPTIYRPISSTKFQDFMIQTYMQYSRDLQKILQGVAAGKDAKEAEADIAADKVLDKDACKRRDPNKVETFYYQKLVRDYLQRNSPYRGLLVYHGLGSGKTCTSIAAAEALYWGGRKTIFILTPATLSNNYKRELGKCGYFPLRQNNHWSFLSVPKAGLESFWLENVLGLPADFIKKYQGGWVPEPDKPSNWEALGPAEKESIIAQQAAHLNHRFRFIHYNGILPETLAQLAASGVREGKSMFDEAVVIIDEVHNLVRTINGTQLGGRPLYDVIETMEPREPTWSTPLGRSTPGYRYPRGYSLYRLLQNAVGAKIIALSATPMINYPQELSILLNIIGGEQRVVEIPLKGVSKDGIAKLEAWALNNPTVDYYAIEENERRETILTLTPVPYGFSKVVDDKGLRGFFRDPATPAQPVENSRERKMGAWAVSLLQGMESGGFLVGDRGDLSSVAAASAVAAGTATKAFTLRTFPMLPENPKVFVENFIDVNTLDIMHKNVLKARASGLISYYRGGGDEMMPRVIRNDEVKVEMSEYMFIEYSKARQKELDIDAGTPAKVDESKEGKDKKQTKRKGMTFAEMDLYTQATKSQQSGFLTLSRAACNWVFPTEVPRPDVNAVDQKKLRGIDQGRIIAADLAVDVEEAEVIAEDLPADAADEAPPPPPKEDPQVASIIGGIMAGLEDKGEQYLNVDIATYSPKYAAMLANIRTSPGPVLVYSNFKTLEGLGIFAAALRFAPERYVQLDIVQSGSTWEIPAAIMAAAAGRPRYIMYTGDQIHEKRRLLLQLYNADVRGLPPKLAEQCKELLGDASDNRDGRVCKAFMITQSGAEGISLFNTRQVHIMEPYWNNVRLQQVIGRAIRLCSHMNLTWEERTVEIFTYLSVFSDKQKAEGAKTIMAADKYMSTDEMIFSIATKKQKLADGLFEIAQSSAVDCALHYHEHGKATQCYKFAEGGRMMFMYHPDWRKDIQGAAAVRAAQ